MPAITLYFQVHQPYRLKRYSFQSVGKDHFYLDDESNATIFRKVAKKCYRPTNDLLLKLIQKYSGNFRCAFSITGTALEQMAAYAPDVLEGFKKLAATGSVEFLAETYYHSLASLYSIKEFKEQVRLHAQVIKKYFGQTPTIFRNTELLYSDEIGRVVSELGYRGVLAEGVDDILGWRSPNVVYRVPGTQTKLLLKNYRLSDDIAFRFSDKNWSGYPLTPEKFLTSLQALEGNAESVGIFIDYETFGEHQWESSGIFRFLEELPSRILENDDWSFLTPSEAVERSADATDLSYHRLTSWADIARDDSAWRGNKMQKSVLQQIYDRGSIFGEDLQEGDIPTELLTTWRKLQTSDHFYYMSTKSSDDGMVHSYFRPYETPYDAFINYMNVLRDMKGHYASEAKKKNQNALICEKTDFNSQPQANPNSPLQAAIASVAS